MNHYHTLFFAPILAVTSLFAECSSKMDFVELVEHKEILVHYRAPLSTKPYVTVHEKILRKDDVTTREVRSALATMIKTGSLEKIEAGDTDVPLKLYLPPHIRDGRKFQLSFPKSKLRGVYCLYELGMSDLPYEVQRMIFGDGEEATLSYALLMFPLSASMESRLKELMQEVPSLAERFNHSAPELGRATCATLSGGYVVSLILREGELMTLLLNGDFGLEYSSTCPLDTSRPYAYLFRDGKLCLMQGGVELHSFTMDATTLTAPEGKKPELDDPAAP